MERDYVLGTHHEEIARLRLQHRVWRARVLEAWRGAGFAPGHTLLDIGCGPGYAALDLAEIVGPGGRIGELRHGAAPARGLREGVARRPGRLPRAGSLRAGAGRSGRLAGTGGRVGPADPGALARAGSGPGLSLRGGDDATHPAPRPLREHGLARAALRACPGRDPRAAGRRARRLHQPPAHGHARRHLARADRRSARGSPRLADRQPALRDARLLREPGHPAAPGSRRRRWRHARGAGRIRFASAPETLVDGVRLAGIGGLVGLLLAYLAGRALRVDPTIALRAET